MTAPIKVLSVIGCTRSGSTLLDNLLGSLDGFFSTGELRYIWERGLIEGRACGCGRPVSECDVWSRVLRVGFGSERPDHSLITEIIRWQRDLVRTRHTHRILRGGPSNHRSTSLNAYTAVASKLYHAIAEVTQARVIVDSSKRPSDGAVTTLLPGIEPYFVHLVRDPRAVAFSWGKHKQELDHPDETATAMPRHGVLSTCVDWMTLNLTSELVVRRNQSRSLSLRYEDLVERPRDVLAAIRRLVGEGTAPDSFIDEKTAILERNHTVSGNPDRFFSGRITVRNDERWMREQSAGQRLAVEGLTLPLMRRYGYLGRKRSRPKAPSKQVISVGGRD